MKASEYIEYMKKLVEEYGDKDLVYSSDDEGNYFSKVFFAPAAGIWEDDGFVTIEIAEEKEKSKVNAFCIN